MVNLFSNRILVPRWVYQNLLQRVYTQELKQQYGSSDERCCTEKG
mgnify:CR=1 FL=1